MLKAALFQQWETLRKGSTDVWPFEDLAQQNGEHIHRQSSVAKKQYLT